MEDQENTTENKKIYKSGIFNTSINTANVIIGSGIITLPISFANAGIGVGIIILVISSFLAQYTASCLAILSDITGKNNYQKIIVKTLKLPGYIITTICCIFSPYFAVLAYGIIIGDNFTNIFSYLTPNIDILQNRMFIIGMCMFFIVLPLSMFKSISFLDKASLLSIICVIYYFFVIIAMTAFVPQKIFLFPNLSNFGNIRIPQALSTMAFALTCHPSVPPLYRALKNKSVKRFNYSLYITFLFCTIIYIIFGMFGYFNFAGNVDGNLLENYCSEDKVIISARFIFSFTLILTCPLQIFTVRENINQVAFKFMKFSWIYHIIITTVLVTIIFLVASYVRDLGLVVGITGALVISPAVFILPTSALYVAFGNGLSPNNKTKIACLIIAILGIALLILGVIMTIIDSGAIPRIRYWCDFNVIESPPMIQDFDKGLKGFILDAWSNLNL